MADLTKSDGKAAPELKDIADKIGLKSIGDIANTANTTIEFQEKVLTRLEQQESEDNS